MLRFDDDFSSMTCKDKYFEVCEGGIEEKGIKNDAQFRLDYHRRFFLKDKLIIFFTIFFCRIGFLFVCLFARKNFCSHYFLRLQEADFFRSILPRRLEKQKIMSLL